MSNPRKNRGTGRDMKKHNSALYWRIQEARKKAQEIPQDVIDDIIEAVENPE
jgi:hypothetical protein